MSNKVESRMIVICEAVDFDFDEQYKKELARKERVYWFKFIASLAFMLTSTLLISSLMGAS